MAFLSSATVKQMPPSLCQSWQTTNASDCLLRPLASFNCLICEFICKPFKAPPFGRRLTGNKGNTKRLGCGVFKLRSTSYNYIIQAAAVEDSPPKENSSSVTQFPAKDHHESCSLLRTGGCSSRGQCTRARVEAWPSQSIQTGGHVSKYQLINLK